MALVWLIFSIFAMQTTALPDIIRIGGLFHPSDDKQGVAFRYAVEKINANRDILPRSRLSAQIEQISPQDSFHASKRELGLQVVFDFYVFHVLEFSQLIKLSVQELLVFEEFEWKNKSA
ncbi:hypothetical protein PV325_007315 [Microctonus aethiopoides]|nr:hypothetical protein PV325_007315 [Microctonus aethiopoides]